MQLTYRKWIKEYLTFSQKERRAVIVLAIAATLFALLPTIFPFLVKNDVEIISNPETEKELAQLKTGSEKNTFSTTDENNDVLFEPKHGNYGNDKTSLVTGTVFYFDPNTASAEDWEKLGLRNKTIQTILNYRDKGGKFRHAEDLAKIYGLHKDDYERLAPYVKIEPADAPNQKFSEQVTNNTSNKPAFTKPTLSIDINSADTTEWKKLNGIGSKLSQRIVNFRSKLGGFVSIEQVAETFGLPDSTFQKIKPQLRYSSAIKKININTATLDELKQHPYIRYAIAKAIVQYRTEHGSFKTVENLQKIGAIDEEAFRKIVPYITAE